MISLLASKKQILSPVFCLLLSASAGLSSVAAEQQLTIPSHPYASYSEFAQSTCLPCHYQNIPNGTDLSALFSAMSEVQLQTYLGPILKEGNMPPDKPYREVLYLKFLDIQ